MAITPLPPAPEPTDSTSEFNSKAFAFVGALDGFVTETNAVAVEVDADKTTATNAASTATTKANEASASADLAEDWATKTDGAVAGGEFSAKKYAQDSFNSAAASAASAVEAAGLVENYQGALSSDPSVNKDGDPLVAGDWYVNTSTGLIRAYTGSAWVTSVNVTAGVTSFSGGSTGLTPSTGTQGDVTLAGTLGVANGGTGAATLTANHVLLGNGTSALQAVAPGSSGNILTSNGTTWTSGAPPAGSGSIEAIASGVLPNGAPIVLNSDGTVSVVSATGSATNPPVSEAKSVLGSNRNFISSAYDVAQNKIVIFSLDNSGKGTAHVGTLSGSSISFGSEAQYIATGTDIKGTCVYDPVAQKIVIFYVDNSAGYYIRAKVGTVSGTNITFGSEVNIDTSGNNGTISAVYDASNQKVVCAFTSNFGVARAIVGNISGTSFVVGTSVQFGTNITNVNISYDSNQEKVVIFYRDGNNSGRGTAIVGTTTSGNAISFGSSVVFESSAMDNTAASFNTQFNKFFVFYNISGSMYAKVGTVSGTSISFSDRVTYSATGLNNIGSNLYVPTIKAHYISYKAGARVKIVRAQIVNNLPSFGTEAIISGGDSSDKNQVIYHETNQKLILSYRDDTASLAIASNALTALKTNLSASSFVGFSDGSYSDAATATIQTIGSINDGQTGLTTGSVYYVQPDGTLSTTAGTPKVTAGIATSATEILVSELITPPAPSGWELISSVSASNSATIDITSGFDATYRTYAIVVTGVIPATNNVNFEFQTQRSGTFANVDLANHAYNGTTSVTGSLSTSIAPGNMTNDASYGGGSYIFYVNDPTNTTAYKKIYGNGSYTKSDLSNSYLIFGGAQNNIAALTGVRFQMQTGNIASGTFKLYGIRG